MSVPPVPATSLDSLRHWFELAADAMLAVAPEGDLVLVNPRAERMFGYADGTLCGQALETLVPESLRAAHRQHRHAYLAQPVRRVMETQHELSGLRRDGSRFPIGISLSPVQTERGLLVIASVRDISQTWRARQVLERARRDRFVLQIGSLAVESPDYERAIQQIPEQVATALAIPTVVVFATDLRHPRPRIRAATGLSSAAAATLTAAFGDIQFIRSSFAPGGLTAITGETLREDRFASIRAGLAQAGFADLAMVPLFGHDEPLGALAALAPTSHAFDRDKVGFLHSVANLLASAVQRSHTEEQLAHAQRLDAVGQLTGGIAHDFNNLLTVVSGNLQLLEAELPADTETRAILDGALRAVDRGADLTRRLLAFARRQPLWPRPVVPQPLLDELGHMLTRTLGEVIEVEVDCAADVPDVYADANELDTALVNLALNARDAMPRGGKLAISARRVQLATTPNPWSVPPGAYVEFTVADTGTGMTPAIQAHACEPFFTTKGSGKGSGLGLSMVHGFVTQSGGNLALHSRLGYGTQVAFVLPIASSAPAQPRPAEPPRDVSAGHQETILVVEDEADVRTIAARFLGAIGYQVLVADSARAALAILASESHVDLLFSDVVLGDGMTGVELARTALGQHPALAVLLTSGYAGTPGSTVDADAAPEFALLRKPYRRDELAEAVRARLARR